MSDPATVTDHESHTAFLRQCLLYGDSAERHQLEEKLAQAQRHDRCVQRAVWLIALLIALSAVGLAYGAVLEDNFFFGESWFVIRLLSEIGLAALISLAVFVVLWVVYRRQLNHLRRQCRRLATTFLESRLGKPRAIPLTGVIKEQELIVNHNQAVVSASEMVVLPTKLRSP